MTPRSQAQLLRAALDEQPDVAVLEWAKRLAKATHTTPESRNSQLYRWLSGQRISPANAIALSRLFGKPDDYFKAGPQARAPSLAHEIASLRRDVGDVRARQKELALALAAIAEGQERVLALLSEPAVDGAPRRRQRA